MSFFRSTLKFALLILCAIPAWSEEKPDELLAKLTDELVGAAKAEPGVGETAQKLTKKLKQLDHEKVVEAVLPLLKHEKKGVPYLASYVILECKDGLRPEHLDQLVAGYHKGGGWLPGAIASLHTDQATEFLAKEFRSNPQIHGQLDWALISLGERAVPFLLKEFDDADPEKEPEFFVGLRHLFKGDYVYDGLRARARMAIPHLMKIAESEDANQRRRQEAIKMIGCVGEPAVPFFPRLRVLAEKEPVFDEAVTQAIILSETSATAVVLANMVDEGAGHYTVREIALLGSDAKDVGPRVLRWLNHPNWEIRVMAARTLGAIAYEDAVKSLEGLLSSKSDWRLAYVATKSLADLRATESIPALERASKEHWFPIVRDAAKMAMRSLKKENKAKEPRSLEARDLGDYVFVNRDQLAIAEEDLRDLKPPQHGEERQTSFRAFQEREPAAARKFIQVRKTDGEEILIEFGSMIAFPVGDGVLLGASAGEWIGGLHHAPKEGEHRRLLDENVFGIEQWKGRVFVASGTYHMGMNEGFIHEVVREADTLALVPWFVLPGLPNRMWVTSDGKLNVECIGGALSFAGEGEFRYYGSKPLKQNSP